MENASFDARIPKHITPTIMLCFAPYLGLVAFLMISHHDEEVLRHPASVWLAGLATIGALAPLGRLGALVRLLVRERDRFRMSLLLQVYASLVLIFASLYALLQVGQVEPAFAGMLEFWSMEGPGTLGHHVAMLTRVFGESLYLSVVTITTVGFGDIVPVGAAARVLVMVEALIGIGFLGARRWSVFLLLHAPSYRLRLMTAGRRHLESRTRLPRQRCVPRPPTGCW